MFKRYLFYLLRWQLSTPILSVVLWALSDMNILTATIIANFIGGLMFFWIDKIIFKQRPKLPLWEIKKGKCSDCGCNTEVRRIVNWGNYDKTNDKRPKFRCTLCSQTKTEQIKK